MGHQTILCLVAFLLIFSTNFAMAEEDVLGYFEQDIDIEVIQICSSATSICDSCNISSIKYPKNSTSIVTDVEMTKRTSDFYYNLDANFTNPVGWYVVSGVCNSGSEVEVFSFKFYVSPNGKEPPSEGVIVFFSILFIFIVGSLLGMVLYNIFRMIEWKLDARDLIFNVSAYFALFVTYILGKEYLGNIFFNDFIVWLIVVGALTNVILPIIGFVMSYVRGGLEQHG